MKMMKELLVFSCIAICINMAMAQTNHTIGWRQGTDYQTWASSETFLVGDNLIFQYGPNHDVAEVSSAEFASCTASNPLQPIFTGGETVISLTAPGSRYFICTTPGHCLSGMKVQIDTTAPPATPPSLPPPPPATPPSVPSAPPPATPPSVPSAPPPRPSSGRPTSAPSPSRLAPSPSPIKTPAPSKSTSPPPAAPTPAASLPPSPPPSAAANVRAALGLTAGFGVFLMMLLNL